MNSTLSPQALKVIEDYSRLRINGQYVNCPYFNNRTTRLRAALRVMIGKGTPAEIAEEVRVFGHKEQVDFSKLSEDKLKQYLLDHYIGVECSGFVYHVLEAELRARGKKSLKHALQRTHSFVRRFITRLRPVENTSVATFVDERNSHVVPLADIRSGDLIIAQGAGTGVDRDHILVVTSVTSDTKTVSLSYAHSFDDKVSRLSGGVRVGEIVISEDASSVLDGAWTENGQSSPKVKKHVQSAESVSLRRLLVFK